MRPIWKGSLAFGLVNVPIKVYSATEDHDVRFHQVHDADGGRIKYQRICEKDGKVVEYSHIEKAFESDDGRTVVLSDDDFDTLPANHGHEIEVLEFVPTEQLDPVLFDRAYYLEPDGKSVKAYVLLRKTLEKTDRTAIVHFALREKTRLAALRVRDKVLMVQTLLWPDEVRAADFPALSGNVSVSAGELKMASTLVDSISGDFKPEKFTDEYREQLEQLIDAKLEGDDAFPTEEVKDSPDDQDAEVVDLLAALRSSVDRSKGRTTGGAKSTGSTTRSTTRKRATSATSKSTAAKSAASKSAAAKSAASKSTAAKSAATKRSAAKAPSKSAVKTPSKSGAKTSTTAKRPAAKRKSA